MKRTYVLSSLFTGILTSAAFAGTMGPISQSNDWHRVSTISAGPVWEQAGNTQTFYLTPEIEKTYAANQPMNVIADGEFFVGIEKYISRSIQTQVGLAIAASTNASLSGVIWDDADPRFSNFTYKYQVQPGLSH